METKSGFGPYDAVPSQEIRAAAARLAGDSVAAARARWQQAVDPLDRDDRRIIDWAVNAMDQSTLWVFAGLLGRHQPGPLVRGGIQRPWGTDGFEATTPCPRTLTQRSSPVS